MSLDRARSDALPDRAGRGGGCPPTARRPNAACTSTSDLPCGVEGRKRGVLRWVPLARRKRVGGGGGAGGRWPLLAGALRAGRGGAPLERKASAYADLHGMNAAARQPEWRGGLGASATWTLRGRGCGVAPCSGRREEDRKTSMSRRSPHRNRSEARAPWACSPARERPRDILRLGGTASCGVRTDMPFESFASRQDGTSRADHRGHRRA